LGRQRCPAFLSGCTIRTSGELQLHTSLLLCPSGETLLVRNQVQLLSFDSLMSLKERTYKFG